MVKFLFWNLNRKNIEPLIASIARQRDVDVIILAECESSRKVLGAINQSNRRKYNYHVDAVKRIEIFSRFPRPYLTSLGSYNGLNFRKLMTPIGAEILLVSAHLSSKFHMSEADQMFECTRLVSKIQEFEDRLGHRRTVVVGDLNMKPFELGMVASHGFHAVSSRQIAKRMTREIKGETYHFFYNPMWNCLGDQNSGPPGTYYYDTSSPINFYWNTFDQLLIRPSLLKNFVGNDLEIITFANGINLLNTDGKPNMNLASDHLPVFFTLYL